MEKKNNKIKKIKKRILPILKDHSVKKAGIFGSYAKNQDGKESDIDILVKVDEDLSLLDFVGLKLKLEDELGQKVDLVEYQTIKSEIKDSIIEDQISIL